MLYVGNLNNLSSGYAQAGLHHLASLVHIGFTDFGIFSRNAIPWNIFPTWCNPLRSLAFGASRTPILVHNTTDQLATTLKRDAEYIGLTAIDTDHCPKWAAIGINRTFSKLIVPSTHSAQAAAASGVKIPIVVVPHTMHSSLWEESAPTGQHSAWVFYYIGSWNARKNPEDVIKAYVRAFPNDDLGVRLVMKLTAQDGIKLAVHELIRDELRKLGRSVPTDDYQRRDIVINCGNVSVRDIKELHAYGDCYVTACRGEAFGLSAFEAALLAKPVIFTNWGGYCDFLSRDRGDYPVDYTLAKVSGMSGMAHFSGDQQWAQIDIEAMSVAMQTAARVRNTASSDELRKNFGYDILGARLLAALEI